MLKTKEKCAITGLPAKYRDPVTGLPYANLEAFKVIREQHTPKELTTTSASTSKPNSGAGDATKPAETGGHACINPNIAPAAAPSSSESIADGSIVTAEQLARLGAFPASHRKLGEETRWSDLYL